MIEIKNKIDCTGCEACAAICPVGAISLSADREGFLYPQVDGGRCIECGACQRVCPVINPRPKSIPIEAAGVINPDHRVRKESSSGGLFTLLAEQVISRGGVVFGAASEPDGTIAHRKAESVEEIAPLRGSKYSQSRMGQTYREVIRHVKAHREVLFSGTPCQVSAMGHILTAEERERVLMVDLVCHGVPSPAVWAATLRQRIGSSTLRRVNFRDKRRGWENYGLSIAYTDKGKERESFIPAYRDRFMVGFVRSLYCRPSCAHCPAKGLSSGADLTLGDFWGVGELHPQIERRDGVGLILVGSERGRKALAECGAELFPTEFEKAALFNPSIMVSKPQHPARERFFEEWLGAGGTNTLSIIGKYANDPLLKRLLYNLKKLCLP